MLKSIRNRSKFERPKAALAPIPLGHHAIVLEAKKAIWAAEAARSLRLKAAFPDDPAPGSLVGACAGSELRGAHVLGSQADAILVAPATADFIAKLAHGHCDDLLSTLCLARDIPLLVAPAMNRQMWQNPATQRNINQLRADGIGVLGPDAGEQACGEVGAGRMLEPLDLIEELNAFFTPKLLQGKRILLTAGPTYEAIVKPRLYQNTKN